MTHTGDARMQMDFRLRSRDAFLLEEYRDLYQNVMHLEDKIFNHMSFSTTLFLGVVTASVAIFQLAGGGAASNSRMIALISIPFVALFMLGRFGIRMTTELRLRKVKFIEGIVRIREYFSKDDNELHEWLILPSIWNEAPPYMRVGSKDWYQLVYLCALNSLSLFIATVALVWSVARFLITSSGGSIFVLIIVLFSSLVWIMTGLVIAIFVFWRLSYRREMDFCAQYDLDRERKIGSPTEYNLMEIDLPKNILSWSFGDWIRRIDMGVEKGER